MNAFAPSIPARAGMAFDRALSVIAPGYAATRMEARLKVSALQERMYQAAQPTEDEKGWIPFDGDVNSLIRLSSQPVRARVRDLVRNFPYAKRAIKLREALVIGKGMRIQGRLYENDDGRNLDKEANKLIESTFARWAERADISGRLSFAELQALAERQLFECGEYFFIKRHVRDDKNPFRLQPIEADRLPFTGGTGIRLADNCDMINGVEYRKDTGAPVAYHFQDDGYSAKTIRVPAEMVIHGFEMERPGQMRGISPIASSVRFASDFRELLEAELEAMRMASHYMAFVHSAGKGIPALQTLDGKGKNKNVEKLNHATIQYMAYGEDVKLVKIDRQSGTFEPYVNLNIRTFAISCGLTFELVSGIYDHISYSNLRGIRLDLAMTIRPIQRFHMRALCNPAAIGCFNAAMLTDPDFMRVARRLVPGAYTWVPPGQESPDTLRETKAWADGINMGIISPQDICAEKGLDYAEQLDKIAEAKKMAEERGITLGQVLASLALKTNVKTNPAALTEENDNA
jgi:lambda family phage portal protein